MKPSKFIPIIASGSNLNLAPLPPVGTDYAFLAHPSYWASDASHLVPCAAGDAIRWWKDAVTGTWYEQATSGNRFIARQDVTGKWYAESTATQFHPWVDLTGVSATNLSWGIAHRIYTQVRYAMLISNTLSASVPVRELSQADVTTKIQLSTNNYAGSIIEPTANIVNVDYSHIAIMSGTSAIYRNGVSVASGADPTTNTLGVTGLGGRIGNPAYNYNGRIYGALMRTNQYADVAAWYAALNGYYTAA